MKTYLVSPAIVLSLALALVPRASAQTASLTYTDVPDRVHVGVPFTIGINVVFTSGGGIPNLNGFSLWLAQAPAQGPFTVTITDRDLGASLFDDLQSSNAALGFPAPPGGGQIMTPINTQANGVQILTDLGALSGPPVADGTYFIANFTFVASAAGTFQIGNTTSATPGVGGRISVITDNMGDTIPISESLTLPITATTSADLVAPGAVTNLSATELGGSTVTIQWTAAADDAGNPGSGPVDHYTIRYWVLSMPGADFNSGTTVPAPAPVDPAGMNPLQSTMIAGLSAGTTYGIGITASDGTGSSPVSTLTITTLADPSVGGSAATDGKSGCQASAHSIGALASLVLLAALAGGRMGP